MIFSLKNRKFSFWFHCFCREFDDSMAPGSHFTHPASLISAIRTVALYKLLMNERFENIYCDAQSAFKYFTFSLVLQACFVPLGEKGIYLKGIFLGINMYTMAGIFCVFLGIINLAAAWKYVRDNTRAKEKDSDSEDQHLLEGTAITAYLLLEAIFELTE